MESNDRNDTEENRSGVGNMDTPLQKRGPYNHKSWIFTLNNYKDEDIERFKEYTVSRMVVGKEVGAQGTPHLQGYVTWKRAYSKTALKKMEPRCWWQPAKCKDAANYCMKEGADICINVDNTNQGKRTDLDFCVELVKLGGIKKLIEEAPDAYIKYHAGLEKYACKVQGVRSEKPVVEWIWGPTGTGKTRGVFEKENDLWVSSEDLKWFDGYMGHEAVLIDDFRSDMCKFRFLLRLLDRYPLSVPIKGGFTAWVPKRIYITSCKKPEDVYNKENFDNHEKVEQLLRRIDVVTYKSGVDDDFFVELFRSPCL